MAGYQKVSCVADLDQVQPEVAEESVEKTQPDVKTAAMFAMKNTRPESLAVKGHDYEELPHGRYVRPGYKYDYADEKLGRPAPPPLVSMPSQASMDNLGNGSVHPSTYPQAPRKRENPLYDAYDERDHLVKDEKDQSACSRCGHLAVLVLCFVCFLTLALVILMLIGILPKSDSFDSPMTSSLKSHPNSTESQLIRAIKRIQDLENKYAALLDKMQKMSLKLDSGFIDVKENVSSQSMNLSNLQTLINAVNSDTNSRMTVMNSTIHTQLQTISKMEGPMGPRGFNGSQGPPGVGDLSVCRHIRVSKGSAEELFYGTWAPTAQVLKVDNDSVQNWIVMGAECSTKGVKEHELELRDQSGITQYRCICSGKVDGVAVHERFCELHLWLCPRIS